MPNRVMTWSHILLTLGVVIVWGFNFVVIEIGLKDVSPLLLCLARFILAALPIFFIAKPRVSQGWLCLYGLFMFALQFGLLFGGMACGVPAGIASLLLQVQVFFTMLLAIFFLGEKPLLWQILGALVSFCGLGVLALHLGSDVSVLGFFLILSAAASFAAGNLIVKKIGNINVLALIAYGSVYALPFLLPATIFFEAGSYQALLHFHEFSALSVLALLYIVVLSTWFGYGSWNYLMSRYPVASIAPFTLLVPVCAILSAHLVLGESLPAWKIMASLMIVAGLIVNVLGPRLFR